jgi:RHS repeat-associated protein
VNGGITYTQQWDPENRLSVVTNTVSGVVTRFTYDGDGHRVLQTIGSATTMYLGSQYEKDITSGTVTTYYYAGGQRIALRQGRTVSWLAGDHLGSTTLTANSAGAKTAELLYSPFGTTRYTWGTTPTSYGFTGQRADQTGFMYYVAPYYDPAVGRWTQADTIVPGAGDPQNLNRYTYASNRPVNRLDPSGHDDEPWWKRLTQSACDVFPLFCQPGPNLVPNLDEVLAVSPITGSGISFEGEGSQVQALFAAQSNGNARSNGRAGAIGHIRSLIGSLLSGGGAKLAQEGFNKLCSDGDCMNEATGSVNIIKMTEKVRIGLGQNLGIAWSNIKGIVERKVSGSSYVASRGLPKARFLEYDSFLQQMHSEAQLLEYYAQKFWSDPNVSGTIHLFTQRSHVLNLVCLLSSSLCCDSQISNFTYTIFRRNDRRS